MDPTPGEQLATTDDPVKLQAPPFKMRLFASRIDRPCMLALVALTTAVGRYAGQMEHWHAPQSLNGLQIGTLDSDLELDAIPLASETEATLEAWFSSLSPAFTCRRQVEPKEWSQGAVYVAAELIPRLYWMAHPDDNREILGLLLVTDSNGQLVSTAWYRSSPPPENGHAFKTDFFSGRLVLVRDGDGKPSVDPKFIKENVDWYSIAMPLR